MIWGHIISTYSHFFIRVSAEKRSPYTDVDPYGKCHVDQVPCRTHLTFTFLGSPSIASHTLQRPPLNPKPETL